MLKNMESETGPILPRNIVPIITAFPAVFRFSVRPRESPTVPMAETTSYRQSRKSPGQTAVRSVMETTAAVRLAMKIARALRTVFALIFRCRNSVKSFSFSMESTVKAMIRKVVVLMPPAVPEGYPPINMRMQAIMHVLFRSLFCEMV